MRLGGRRCRNFRIVERSTPARSAACAIVYSPRSNETQILNFSDGDRTASPATTTSSET
jgi:hypothetical protein